MIAEILLVLILYESSVGLLILLQSFYWEVSGR